MLNVVYAVVVCLCVCLSVSVTLHYCIKTAKRRITQIMPHDSAGSLVFHTKVHSEIRTGSPSTEATNAGGVSKMATFDEKCTITRKRYKIDA